jgi:hypothetical protein
MKIGAKKISLFAACFFQQNPLLFNKLHNMETKERKYGWKNKQTNKIQDE